MGLFETVKTEKRLLSAQEMLLYTMNEASTKHFIVTVVKGRITITAATTLNRKLSLTNPNRYLIPDHLKAIEANIKKPSTI